MARWGKLLWAVGLGAVMATSAFAEAPAKEAVSARAPSANEQKSQFLARVQAYSELAEEMSRMAAQKSQDERFTQLAAQWKKDYLDANGRLTNYVLTRRVNLPDPVLEGEAKNRFRVAMINVENLRHLSGAQFERRFANVAAQLPGLTARELMTARQSFADDQELMGVVDPLLAMLDQHQKAAETLANDLSGSPAAARRPPAQR